VATDSEWDDRLEDPWLCTTFHDGRETTAHFRAGLPAGTRRRLQAAALRLGVRLLFGRRDDATDLVGAVRADNLAAYFSPRDLEFACGWDRMRRAYLGGQVHQRRSLTGRVGPSRVVDPFGWNKEGLGRLARALGVALPEKSLMDEYKRRMVSGLLDHPEDFLRYAVADARALYEIVHAFAALARDVQAGVGLRRVDRFTPETVPTTIGSVVARTLEPWVLRTAAFEHFFEVDFCLKKLGLLDPDSRRYAGDREAWADVVERYTRPGDLLGGETPDPNLDRFFEARYAYTGLDQCSVRWFASRSRTETAAVNALVHGGRCNNEDPYRCRLGKGLDIDIAGCYGEALRSLLYPLGLPTVLSYAPNDRRMTLGDFLRRHDAQLVPGLWTVTVRGVLPFDQDLVYSKLLKPSRTAPEDLYTVGEDGRPHAEFALLRREIVNGVVTADVLDVLRKAATAQEWMALQGLEVVTACFYRAADRQDTLENWVRAVMADGGRYQVDPDSPAGCVKDDRTRAWFAIPLEDFVGRLVERRKVLKARAKDAGLPEDERRQAESLDYMLKLFVNTTYGVLASRFFPVGNVVVANNITARGRVGVWLTAKALGLLQTVTEGGIYAPQTVPSFRGKRPGLDTLSRMWEWRNRERRRSHVNMGGLDWEDEWDQLPSASDLDWLAQEHVRDFWAPYGLDFPFRLEHKADNAFTAAAYWSKGDYALETARGRVYKLRGKERNRRDDARRHPTYALLDAILEGRDDFPDDLTYTRSQILKVGTWRLAQTTRGYEDLKDLRPGQNTPTKTYTARYNNTHFPTDTAADYYRRRNRRKEHHGTPMPWFEKYGPGGIQAVLRAMETDKL
jgi:hypothetical protein